MVRRPPVERLPSGVPAPHHRCAAMVRRRGELFNDRCKRARLRGSAYCEQHDRIEQLKLGVQNGQTDTDPETT